MGGSPSETETETEPWDAQQPYLKEGFRQAQRNILNRPLEYFPGKTWVPYSPESRMGMRQQANRARSGSPLLRGAQGYTGDVMGGDYLGGSGAVGADPAKMYDSILSEVEPAVASRWASAGRMGGSPSSQEAFGRGVTRGIAPYEFQAAEAAANRRSGEYMTERGFMENAADRAPGLAREDYFDIGKLAEVGRMREAKKGEKLADRMSRWEFAQNEPGSRIERFMRQIQGNYGGTSTAQQTGGGGFGQIAGPALGAGLALAGMPTAGGGSLGGNALSK